MQLLKLNEATAARRRIALLPVDETDGVTAETGRTLSGTEVQVFKNFADAAQGGGSVVEKSLGLYYYEATQGELDTVGVFAVTVYESGMRRYWASAQVVAFDPYAAIPTAAEVADSVWDEAVAGHVSAGTFGANLDDSVGSINEGVLFMTTLLSQTIKAGAHFDAKTEVLTRDGSGRPLTAVRRCYDSAENAATDDGSTGLVGTLSMTTTYTAEGKVATYKATWEAA